MKVNGIESARWGSGGQRPEAGPLPKRDSNSLPRPLFTILFLVALAFALTAMPLASSARSDDKGDKESDAKEKTLREARKAARGGKYQKAIELYRGLLDKDARDIQARLGISHAYLKEQNYLHSFEHAAEALKIDPSNARAHALVGAALLRSGLVRAAVPELQRAMDLNPKEALAYGGAAEVDYFEGRIKE